MARLPEYSTITWNPDENLRHGKNKLKEDPKQNSSYNRFLTLRNFAKRSGGIQILTKQDSSDYLQKEVILRSISSKYLISKEIYQMGDENI